MSYTSVPRSTYLRLLKTSPIWRTPIVVAHIIIAIGATVYAILGLSGWSVALLVLLLALIGLAWVLFAGMQFIDGRINLVLGRTDHWPVHNRFYPLYKMVDIYHASASFAKQHPNSVEIRSAHPFPLAGILSGRLRRDVRRIVAPMMFSRKVAYDTDESIPTDTFWLVPATASHGAFIIRVWLPRRDGFANLEVAAPGIGQAEQIIEQIGEIAIGSSIYRGSMIRVVFDPEVRGDYDDDESMEPMDLVFVKPSPIADGAIVLDEQIRGVVERTIIDFHQRRSHLMDLGLPGKRGILFYGPPGTGKTYTCKYIAGRLEQCTTLVVTGHALLRMKAICALARAFQPALVLLEDVDLVFASREINSYNTVLGEFIDQLDGFGEFDQVIFILTTNAIERIESAIKDRPGRVSQCVYFGPPSSQLRRRYLESLLGPFGGQTIPLDRIVTRTDGVSQAFLKELVFRAVQIASAEPSQNGKGIALSDEHLEAALHEMTNGSDRYTQRIIGFRVDGGR